MGVGEKLFSSQMHEFVNTTVLRNHTQNANGATRRHARPQPASTHCLGAQNLGLYFYTTDLQF